MGTVCRINSCCCGCSLRTGALIIAIVDLLSALSGFIVAIVLLTDNAYSYDWDWDWNNEPLYYQLSVPLYTLVSLSIVVMINDILLLAGILGGRARLFIPWIMFSYISIFFYNGMSIWIGVTYINNNNPSLGYSTIVSAIIAFGFKLYFILVIRSYANTLAGGTNFSNGVNVTVYPSTLPQAYPNGQQPFYPNVNVQQTGYPNGQPPNQSGQQQFYPNVNVQQTGYPNPSGQQQMYPNGQQTYLNSQLPGHSGQPPPYLSGQPQMPLPPMSEMKREL